MPPTNESLPQAKKRKKDRACDACRRRKTKCDGPWMAGNVCTNCTQTRKSCTYVEGSKPRGPPKSYVTGLEDRLEVLEALLQQARPDVDFSDELGPPIIRDSWKNKDERSTSSSSNLATRKSFTHAELSPISIPLNSTHSHAATTSFVSPPASSRTSHLTFRPKSRYRPQRTEPDGPNSYRDPYHLSDEDSTTSTSSSSDTEEIVVTSLGGRSKITLLASENNSTEDNSIRFHGRSSTAGLVEATRKFKHMHMQEVTNGLQENATSVAPDNETVAQTRRPQFWERPPWEILDEEGRQCIESPESLQAILEYFPPPDLADILIGIFFRHSNVIFPLLHRPTFIRQWRENLHHRNIWFTALCGTLFAVASRWSDDERVLPEGSRIENGELDWTQAGWLYFEVSLELHRARRNLFQSASLFEVQTYTLMGMYLRGTSAFPAAWVLNSIGIRKAQDVGAHRKGVYRAKPTVDEELWKRAFWHLAVFDRIGGASLGRACGVVEEDFDIDLPLEVDDEYWEPTDTREPFTQPEETPSLVTAFNRLIELTRIIAFTMRTLYALNKSQAYRGMISLDRDTLMQQLAPALDDWIHAVPEHLRWNDQIINPIFAKQSSTLMITYHVTEILIYRTLIAPPSSQSPMSTGESQANLTTFISSISDPAVIRCTQAAKSCARIIESALRRGPAVYYIPAMLNSSRVCAGVLLLNAWNIKVQERELKKRGVLDIKPPLAQRVEDNILDIKIFIQALESARSRWAVVDSQLVELHESFSGLGGSAQILNGSSPFASQSSDSNTHLKATHYGHWSSIPPDRATESHANLSTSLNFARYHEPHWRSHWPQATIPQSQINFATSIHNSSSQTTPYPSTSDLLRVPSESPPSRFQPPSHGFSHIRGRATSIPTVNASVHYDDRTLPYISSSMRRTSVPNLSGRTAQAINEIHSSVHAYDSDEGVIRRDDIDMHFEEEAPLPRVRHPQPTPYQPRNETHAYDKSISRWVVPHLLSEINGSQQHNWDRPLGFTGWAPPATSHTPSYVSNSNLSQHGRHDYGQVRDPSYLF